ncbi:casein kinase 2 regulatory subunit [Nowakowskiella sp. JEL0407]|nr:casein kinase 2 regulatory subunit [Nowakowskiella sp. JEL0407]
MAAIANESDSMLNSQDLSNGSVKESETAPSAVISTNIPFHQEKLVEIHTNAVDTKQKPSTTTVKERVFNISGWEITTRKGPISNSVELDSLADQFKNLPYPEMFFGHNFLKLVHESGVSIMFSSTEGLLGVYHTKDDIPYESDDAKRKESILKVPYANSWATRTAEIQDEIKGSIKPYDWTYTSDYIGSVQSSKSEPKATNEALDIALLKTPEPILFSDELILYEDELHDNGVAVFSVRLRVMESCFLVLARFFLRVDGVLFRINETRIFHKFSTNYVVREVLKRETGYHAVRSQLPKKPNHALPQRSVVSRFSTTSDKSKHDEMEDLSLLTDVNWVTSVIPNPYFGVQFPDECSGEISASLGDLGPKDGLSGSEDSYGLDWYERFRMLKGSEFFCEVDMSYIQDRFNLTGLNLEVQHYVLAYELLTNTLDEELDQELELEVERSAQHLYGLIHARFIITSRGLTKMFEKFQANDFGKCPRVLCDGQAVLPVGLYDLPGIKPVKLYCPKCEDIYIPPYKRHASIDGAYFGTSFPHLLLQVYPDILPNKDMQRYVPKIFGFKIHSSAKEQRNQDEIREELQKRHLH